MTSLPSTDRIKLAVVVGGHPYDVPAFRDLFNAIPDVDPYVQDLDNWAVSRVFDQYDAFLFFNMHTWGVLSVRKDMDQKINDALARLGETGQGVIIMHHAILAFPESNVYSEICNMSARGLGTPGHKYTRTTPIEHIPNASHPISQGLEPFTLATEGFLLDEPGENSEVVLSTSNALSSKAVAWTHQHNNARVFCNMTGHDAGDWTDPSYNTVLCRGISWVSGRL